MRAHREIHRIMAQGFSQELIKVGSDTVCAMIKTANFVSNTIDRFNAGPSSGVSMSSALDPKKVSGAAGMANRAMGRAGFGDSPSARPSLNKPVAMGDPLAAPKLQTPTTTGAPAMAGGVAKPPTKELGDLKPMTVNVDRKKPKAGGGPKPAAASGDQLGPPAPAASDGSSVAKKKIGIEGTEHEMALKSFAPGGPKPQAPASAASLSASLGQLQGAKSSRTTGGRATGSSQTTAPKAGRDKLDLSEPGKDVPQGGLANTGGVRPAE